MNAGFARHWGQGPEPAVLLHCSLAHSGAWAGVARDLLDRLSMTAPDMVGHGAAPDHDRAQDYHDQSTAHTAQVLPDAPCHLIGHSLGGTVALRLALEHPDRVRSLTLIEPVLFAAAASAGAARMENRAALAEVKAALEAGEAEQAARRFLSVWGGAMPFHALPDDQKAYMAARVPLILASDPALEQDTAHLVPRLGQVACPVLLIEGANSPAVVAEIQTRLAASMPDTTRVTILDAGHMAPITHPRQTARAIRAFIDARAA